VRNSSEGGTGKSKKRGIPSREEEESRILTKKRINSPRETAAEKQPEEKKVGTAP